eukprot:gnl/TRDRNA2_/TRDRNA2_172311_c0_seq8.p1 gnl/TRDRNA2_/TRDRNA2_172311_c0~~gnl/TRDRNA2_/TRDRNA2_172311_c0_seq8.p1  ORF type:complete len:489 (-),score=29.93 gnl/TRDRNA2_/TRDRNA2_172311_c0_seq8:89-1504(-)
MDAAIKVFRTLCIFLYCFPEGRSLRLHQPVVLNDGPSLGEDLALADRQGAESITVHGGWEETGPIIDEFLTPRFEWRVKSWKSDHQVLERTAKNTWEMFRTLDKTQFSAKPSEHHCNATISVSGQFVGAALQADLSAGLMFWLQRHCCSRAFSPMWADRRNDSNKINKYLAKISEPFCIRTSSPTRVQDCYFLPVSSCHLGAEQWERIRGSLQPFGRLRDLVIEYNEVEAPPKKAPTWANQVDPRVLFGMMFFRQNSRTRIDVARREFLWRKSNPLWPSEDQKRACAAVHIRHGDKLTPFWMKAHRTIQTGFNRTLDDYLDEALAMMRPERLRGQSASELHLPLVFVMSDDADIIHQARNTTRANTFHVSGSHRLDSLSEVLKKGTKGQFKYAVVDSGDMLAWLLSIRLMSMCDFFVGNLESGFTSFIYSSICERRGGHCPKAITMGPLARNHRLFDVQINFPQIVKRAKR